MEFWTSVKVILRRWYVVIPCMVLTVGVALYLVHHIQPSYKASGSVILGGDGQASRPATTPTTLPGINPYANMDQVQLAFLVGQTAGGSDVQAKMTAAHAWGTYSVVNIGSEPALLVSLEASTPAQAMQSYKELVSVLNAELRQRQLTVGAPANDLVSVRAWTSPIAATPQNEAKVKALIVVVIVGVLLTLALTFLVDALLTNRGAGWRSRAQDDEEDDEDEPAPTLTGPVAVPAHIDLDDADLLSINDPEVEPAPMTRRAARFEFALPTTAERGSARSGVAEPSRHHGSLPPWSPPEERPRAAGS
jgi:hypothetical protein